MSASSSTSSNFIGRRTELGRLAEATRKKSASFIVVKGRRRIGKSRLIEEFARQFDRHYVFAGLPPDDRTTAEGQLAEFCRQMARQFGLPNAVYDNWGDALWTVGEHVQKGRVLLFFDEISWLGSKDPSFLGQIKNAWDQRFKKNDRLVFVVCGSASSWIEENLLSSTGFVGRISYTLTLDELPLPDCDRFWPTGVASYEKFKLLSVTGGVPKYLEEIDFHRPAEENIRRLCFTPGGLLVEEFEQIFSHVFLRDSRFYRSLLDALAPGPAELETIQSRMANEHHGRLPEYLRELELAGFVARDYAWNLRSGAETPRVSRFRLKDNYLRFYLKYIRKNRDRIERDLYSLKSLSSLPEWPAMMGLQFENLVAANHASLHRLLGLAPDEIVNANPYFQRRTARQAGCQLDYLVQAKFGTLYVCEVKFSRNPVGPASIQEVQAKIDALSRPRGMSCRPVLIHVNGVSQDVIDSDYFAHVIDLGGLLAS